MRIVILDRDGVINEDSTAFVKSCAEWRAIPGSIEAIARLSRAGRAPRGHRRDLQSRT